MKKLILSLLMILSLGNIKLVGYSAVYNEDLARKGVLNIYDTLLFMQRSLNTFGSISEIYPILYNMYNKLPSTWQINWKLIDVAPLDAQAIADECMQKINNFYARRGSKKAPLTRRFNADSEPQEASDETRNVAVLAQN